MDAPLHLRCPTRRGRHGALTLVECLIASLLLALVASAAMVAISASLQHERYAAEQMVAVDLAQRLLEEVSARPYAAPDDPAPADAAALLDGYTDRVSATGELVATSLPGYTRELSVEDGAASDLEVPDGVGIATVTVTSPSGKTITLRRLLVGI